MEAILDFLRKAVTDGTIHHPENSNPNPSATDRANPKYCAYHRRVEHSTADCRTLKWIIHKKQQAGLIVLDGGLHNIEQEPYPRHEGGPRQRVNVIIGEGEVPSNAGEDYSMSEVGIPEHSINMLVNQKKFRTFFDAMGYSEPARREAVEALAQISSKFQECLIVPEEETRLSSSITFYEEDYMLDDPDHNCALYLKVAINGRRLPKSLVDTGAGVNILSRDVFESLGIPLNRVYATKMKVSGLGDIAKPTYGQVTLEINIGPLTQLVRFYIVEASADFEIILGRPWIHGSRAVASSYHQCVKLRHKGKEITLTASASGIQHSLCLESEGGECSKNDANGSNKRRLEYPRMASVPLPNERGLTQQNRNKATRQRKIENRTQRDRCERLTLPDGRTAYRL